MAHPAVVRSLRCTVLDAVDVRADVRRRRRRRAVAGCVLDQPGRHARLDPLDVRQTSVGGGGGVQLPAASFTSPAGTLVWMPSMFGQMSPGRSCRSRSFTSPPERSPESPRCSDRRPPDALAARVLHQAGRHGRLNAVDVGTDVHRDALAARVLHQPGGHRRLDPVDVRTDVGRRARRRQHTLAVRRRSVLSLGQLPFTVSVTLPLRRPRELLGERAGRQLGDGAPDRNGSRSDPTRGRSASLAPLGCRAST